MLCELQVIEELRHDSELLCGANIMDYSLLLGVHNVPVPVGQLQLETAVAHQQLLSVHKIHPSHHYLRTLVSCRRRDSGASHHCSTNQAR